MYKWLGGNNIAEIGVWQGDNAAEILRRANPKRLLLVDRWMKVDDPTNQEMMKLPRGRIENTYRCVVDRFFDDRRVVVMRMTSLAAAFFVAEASLDWVYIDASHAFDSVFADIVTWSTRVKPGGFVCGHDYAMRGRHPGVQKAVDLVVESGDYEIAALTVRYPKSYALRKVMRCATT